MDNKNTLTNHEQAKRYLLKSSVFGLKTINFSLEPDDKVILLEVLDKESDGIFIIPDFITGFSYLGPSRNEPSAFPLFAKCKFREIVFNNKPNIEIDGCRLFSRMETDRLKIRFTHPECITSGARMFEDCIFLEELDLSEFNTSRMYNMLNMFAGCRSLEEIQLNNFDTHLVKCMDGMFRDCTSLLKLDLSSFNTEMLETMEGFCDNCSNLREIVLESFRTPHLKDVYSAFANCKKLIKLDLSTFDLRQVQRADYMFCNCSRLRIIKMHQFEPGLVLSKAYHKFKGFITYVDY